MNWNTESLTALAELVDAKIKQIEGHTPGPWYAWDMDYGHGAGVWTEPNDWEASQGELLLAGFTGDDIQAPNSLANERLAAAAASPDGGLLACYRDDAEHVADHIRALDEWRKLVDQTISEAGEDTRRTMAMLENDAKEYYPEEWGYLRAKEEGTDRIAKRHGYTEVGK